MDSSDDAASVRNPIKEGCEKEASKENKCIDRPVSQLVGIENVFTSMSQERSSSFVPVNGSRPRSSDDSEQKVNRTKENILQNDTIGNTIDGNQKQVANNAINKFHNIESPSKVESACDKSFDSNCEKSCQRYKMYADKVGNSSCVNGPSTSGTNKSFDNIESGGIRENRKRPSTLRLDRPNIDDNDSSSDTGNDDYSLGSEDGCIYTYRGGEHLADLPSSFFSLDMGLPLDRHLPLLPNYPVPQQGPGNAREQGSRASSPDMDFLEMDFDPGPSCEVDTDDESSPDADLEVANSLPEEIEPVIRGTTPEYLPNPVVNPQPSTSTAHNDVETHSLSVPSTSCVQDLPQRNIEEEVTTDQEYGPYITHVNFRGEQFLVRRTISSWPSNTLSGLHVSNGDLVSPREVINYDEDCNDGAHTYEINKGERPTGDSVNIPTTLYHITMAKRLIIQKTCSDIESQDAANMSRDQGAGCSSDGDTGCVEPPQCMVWSEREACERQVTQIGTSACGATAVVNVFIALGVPVDIERIKAAVGTRQRANNAPIPRYLLSRAVAGCTAADLVTGIQRASDGLVTARFFPLHPERAMSLSHWLADWISLGAVPILTLNLQVGCEGEIPDAWHHQMVFGVSPRGVYLCNPCECVPERALWPRLTSPSVLLVRARDILARLSPNTDLSVLMAVPDRRFHTFNVLGQVASVIREWRAHGWREAGVGARSRHVRLPAAYQAGVTFAALTGSEAHRRLVHAPLPPTLGTRKVSDGCRPEQ
ncbi:PREDICTED: uncharacterized protein LOC106114461 [Papilio xuthus]|uniref:Uncharacterized protein LOC106114461 n=1 Tax=Papilio xuthus TaxID=66420 RepID=A0AAJ6Z1C0_PAPXU|nr:PREDICTED: uncharacterized protein LOC106114461 [Papilio xuthus]